MVLVWLGLVLLYGRHVHLIDCGIVWWVVVQGGLCGLVCVGCFYYFNIGFGLCWVVV